MANWTYNNLVITNLVKEEVEEIANAALASKLCELILPPPDWSSIPNENGELPKKVENEKLEWSAGTQDFRWHSWNDENWGSKWGDCDTSVENKDETSISIMTSTVYSPLGEVFLEALSERYPNASVKQLYTEEAGGPCGASIASEGIVIGKCLNESKIFEEWAKGVDGYSQMNEDEQCEVCSEFFNGPLWEFLDIVADELKQELVASRRTP